MPFSGAAIVLSSIATTGLNGSGKTYRRLHFEVTDIMNARPPLQGPKGIGTLRPPFFFRGNQNSKGTMEIIDSAHERQTNPAPHSRLQTERDVLHSSCDREVQTSGIMEIGRNIQPNANNSSSDTARTLSSSRPSNISEVGLTCQKEIAPREGILSSLNVGASHPSAEVPAALPSSRNSALSSGATCQQKNTSNPDGAHVESSQIPMNDARSEVIMRQQRREMQKDMTSEEIKAEKAKRNRESAKRSRLKTKLNTKRLTECYEGLLRENKELKEAVEILLKPEYTKAPVEVQERMLALIK